MIGLPIVGFVLTVASSFGWSGLDAIRKSLAQDIDATPVVVLLTVGQLPLFVTWALIEASLGAQPLAATALLGNGEYMLFAGASIALNVAANVLYFYAVRASPLSLTVPLLAFIPALSTVLAWPLLDELPSGRQQLGIAAVVMGAMVLNADAAGGKSPRKLISALIREPGTLPMMGVALAWTLTVIVDKRAIAFAPVPVHAAVLTAGVAASLTLWLAVRGRLAALGQAKRAPLRLVCAIGLAALALGLQLQAIKYVFVAVFEAIKRAVGIIMAVLIGRIAFSEPITAAKLTAIGLMAAGTIAVAWP